jgi:hypothetical protein
MPDERKPEAEPPAADPTGIGPPPPGAEVGPDGTVTPPKEPAPKRD